MRLVVAVGGGGDVITAVALARLLGSSPPVVVLSYSWDRLLVDPLPGPRTAAEFDGLHELAPGVLQVTGDATPRSPAGSSLPRLADQLPAVILLLDAAGGAVGMAEQIGRAAQHFGANELAAVDVGGDALTDGHDEGLRSPLADQLAMAACIRTKLPTRLLIAAAGIDGELTTQTISERLQLAKARTIGRLNAGDTETVQSVLQWHPSEASGLLAAATLGRRGTVEVRDAGDQVRLTDDTVAVHALELDALQHISPAFNLVETETLAQADEVIMSLTGRSELRYESAKAMSRRVGAGHHWMPSDLPQIDAFAAAAGRRGADYISMRRLAELAGANSLETYAELTRLLASHRPGEYSIGAYRARSAVAS